jgi:hypothetical protein
VRLVFELLEQLLLALVELSLPVLVKDLLHGVEILVLFGGLDLHDVDFGGTALPSNGVTSFLDFLRVGEQS